MTTTTSTRKTILSGIQPTGELHLGRYFGAIQNWVNLQKDYECMYGIVDYHAMTMPFDPKKLREQVWNLAYDLIAVGLEPENIFIQSMVPEHSELAWIFNCVSSYGEVSRMTQFKDKSQQINEKDKDAFISTGLFTYPVLQAADILIYRADYVPVGKDQDQHLELTRNIAQRFNQVVGKEYFVLPETLYTEVPKVLSTADPSKKMSASLGPKHYIGVFALPDVIRKQIKSAVTSSAMIDTNELKEILQDKQRLVAFKSDNPGLDNMISLFDATEGKGSFNKWLQIEPSGNFQNSRLKEALAERIIKLTDTFRQNRLSIMEDKKKYQERIAASSEMIRKKARKTVSEVKDLIGLMQSKTH